MAGAFPTRTVANPGFIPSSRPDELAEDDDSPESGKIGYDFKDGIPGRSARAARKHARPLGGPQNWKGLRIRPRTADWPAGAPVTVTVFKVETVSPSSGRTELQLATNLKINGEVQNPRTLPVPTGGARFVVKLRPRSATQTLTAGAYVVIMTTATNATSNTKFLMVYQFRHDGMVP